MQTSSETYTIPTQHLNAASPARNNIGKKLWQRSLSVFTSKNVASPADSQNGLRRQRTRETTSSAANRKWWRIRLFRGMANDVRRRAPFYWSDWRDAWDYRVIPATVYMYFAKYVPDPRRGQGLVLLSLLQTIKRISYYSKTIYFLCDLIFFECPSSIDDATFTSHSLAV